MVAGAATLVASGQTVAHLGTVSLAVEEPGPPGSETAASEDAAATSTPTERTTEAGTSRERSPDAPPPEPTPEETGTSEAPAPPPSPEPSEPATPSAPPTQVTEAEQVVTLVNDARTKRGCDPLRVVPELVDAANGHSSDMADRDYFDHTTPEGVGFAERIVAAGYPNPGAENIARGQRSATQVMNSWMESDGHRANILNCQLTAIGVGLDKDGWYWTQNFGY
ncbi:CAP domain-containing protein [Actinophytocola gossypii]|uniref:CAP domain-containing protein n=1 Tax=Actinophytocola gossypii TaxID=2812003 RepID=A0ABT2JA61_9PSEU|nr:CAP domain-containing protein [Actinophytocola gossypii]